MLNYEPKSGRLKEVVTPKVNGANKQTIRYKYALDKIVGYKYRGAGPNSKDWLTLGFDGTVFVFKGGVEINFRKIWKGVVE